MSRTLLLCLLLAAATLAAHARALGCGFVNFDDPVFVVANPMVNRGLTAEGVRWAFTSVHHSQWQPVSWLSHMLDTELFGLEPLGHHLTSVLLHAANTVLLFAVLLRMTGERWPSAGAATLFGLHPVHVESVAWVSSRKDVLALFFGLAVVWVHAGVRARTYGPLRALAAAALLAVGLMAKPILVALPIGLLLLDWWPLGRVMGGPAPAALPPRQRASLGVLLLEKLPLLALSVAASLIVNRAVQEQPIPVAARFTNAAVAYARYLRKAFWPSDLAAFYPHPSLTVVGGWGILAVAGALVVLCGISALAVAAYRTRPWIFVGWAWFLGNLVPVIGIVGIAGHSMADRYAYLPLIGIYVAVAWSLWELALRSAAARRALAGVAPAVLLALGVATWVQAGTWRDPRSLWEQALAVTSHNPVADANIGRFLMENGDLDGAARHFESAIAADPDLPEPYANLALVYSERGDHVRAIQELEHALELDPEGADIHSMLGAVLLKQGDLERASAHLQRALELDPSNAEAQNGFGILLERGGDRSSAIAAYEGAIEARPGFGQAHANLGRVLIAEGQLGRAEDHLRHAARLSPNLVDARVNLAAVLESRGDVAGAEAELLEAVRIDPTLASVHERLGYLRLGKGDLAGASEALETSARLGGATPELYNDLGVVLDQLGRFGRAADAYGEAVARNPGSAEMHNNFAGALWRLGELDRAAEQYELALELQPDLALAHSNYGLLCQAQGRLARAIEEHRRALALDPELLASADNLARILATCSDPALRDGAEAVRWAELGAERTGHAESAPLVTLAAALAEAGRFEEAVRWQERAIELSQEPARGALGERLALYRAGQPYREPLPGDAAR